MIDLIDLLVYIDHQPFGNKRIKVNSASSDQKISHFTINVVLQPEGNPIYVTSLYDGKAVDIRCSPLKALQGHNVYGTNNVRNLCTVIIRKALDKLDIPYTSDQVDSWLAGNFEIRNLDITHRFNIRAGLTVRDICLHLLRTSPVEFKPQWINNGIGLRLSSPNSGASWLFYDKEQELLDKRKKASAHLNAVAGTDIDKLWSTLLNIGRKTIRAELKLSKVYLLDRGLNTGSAWTAKKAQDIFFSELELLPLKTLIAFNEALSVLPAGSLKSTLIHWSHRVDVREVLPRSTYNEHRKAIRQQTGIDIATDAPASNEIELSSIFSPANVHNCRDLAASFPSATFFPEAE